MARYNREFLVPYLQNICALHLARNRIWALDWNARRKLDDCRVYYNEPQKPNYEEPVGCCFYGLLVAVVFILYIIVICVNSPHKSDRDSFWFWVACLFLCAFCIIRRYRAVEMRNNQMKEQYTEQLVAYAEQYQSEIEKTEQEKRIIQMRLTGYQRDIKCIDALLEQMYSVNVVPLMYRDCYAAVYLYNWFSTGGSDDLDHALSMYVLEEIKSRLDRIIENQSQMILNQSIMMANQVRSMEQRKQYERKMLAKVNRLQATSDERLRYTRMIESNTSALAFFANANYLRNN